MPTSDLLNQLKTWWAGHGNRVLNLLCLLLDCAAHHLLSDQSLGLAFRVYNIARPFSESHCLPMYLSTPYMKTGMRPLSVFF
jgi:hypothetical protein